MTGATDFTAVSWVLTTKEKPAGRVDDPDLAEKMKAEVEGILLWAFEGLQRLTATISSLPKVTVPEKTGRQSNGTTTMFMIFWILTGMFA